jgi:hypothetical protein
VGKRGFECAWEEDEAGEDGGTENEEEYNIEYEDNVTKDYETIESMWCLIQYERDSSG